MPKASYESVVDDLAKFVLMELVDDEDVDAVGEQEDLLAELIDSMGAMRLAVYIEERYALQFTPRDYSAENFRCVGSLATFVCKQPC